MFAGLTNLKSPGIAPANTKGLDTGNMTQVGNIATQNLGGNSLTQMMRSLQNYLATQGQSTFNYGQDITGTGLQGFGTAGDTTGTAMGTTGTALDTTNAALGTLSPAESYWSKLLSGDTATMNQAIAPTALQAGTNYANAASNVAMGSPRGGYAGVLGASLPQTQAREVNTALYQLQPQAATALNTIAGTKGTIGDVQNRIAGTQGNIAGIQGQIANWLSSLGIDVSKLGQGFLDMATNAIMTGRGQDVGEHGQSMTLAGQTAGDLTSGINAGINAGLIK